MSGGKRKRDHRFMFPHGSGSPLEVRRRLHMTSTGYGMHRTPQAGERVSLDPRDRLEPPLGVDTTEGAVPLPPEPVLG